MSTNRRATVERTGAKKSITFEGLSKQGEKSFQRRVDAEIEEKGANAPSLGQNTMELTHCCRREW
jgi:hypothetical protein